MCSRTTCTYGASQRNLRWVPDLSHLLRRSPRLDWAAIVFLIEAHRLELPVAVLPRYLMEFGLPVPHDVIGHLRRSAHDVGSTGVDAAGQVTVAVAGGSVARLWLATPSWRGRMRFARWAVAPSPAYVRSSFPNARGWLLPLRYAHRAARFAARPR